MILKVVYISDFAVIGIYQIVASLLLTVLRSRVSSVRCAVQDFKESAPVLPRAVAPDTVA